MINIFSQNHFASLALLSICNAYTGEIKSNVHIYYIDKYTRYDENTFSASDDGQIINVIICCKENHLFLKNVPILVNYTFIIIEKNYKHMQSKIHRFLARVDKDKPLKNYINKINQLNKNEEEFIKFFIIGAPTNMISMMLNKSEKQISQLKRSAMKKINAKNSCELLQRGRLIQIINAL